MLTVREAKVGEAERLREIYDYYVRQTAITFEYETPTVEEFRERMRRVSRRYPYLVILKDGVIQGYAYAGPFNQRAAYDWCCELSVYLAKDARRCGMGRTLYEALEQALREMGICNLYACIAYTEQEDEYLTKNSAEFHEHLGFRQVGFFGHCGYKFGRWYDMIWMEKVIGEHTSAQPPVRLRHGDMASGDMASEGALSDVSLAHTALYVHDLEAARDFFCRYLGGAAGALYQNSATGFSSYFLRFCGGTQLELMSRPGLAAGGSGPQVGYAHAAFAVGSRERVDALTARLGADGYAVVSGPRVTGDGYYESCVEGPEGILVELTV